MGFTVYQAEATQQVQCQVTNQLRNDPKDWTLAFACIYIHMHLHTHRKETGIKNSWIWKRRKLKHKGLCSQCFVPLRNSRVVTLCWQIQKLLKGSNLFFRLACPARTAQKHHVVNHAGSMNPFNHLLIQIFINNFRFSFLSLRRWIIAQLRMGAS